MSAFNELVVQNDREELAIQFKYGARRQIRYKLGERIQFDGEIPRGKHEIAGTARDAMGNWRYFSLTFNGDVIEALKEITEAEFLKCSAIS